MKMKSRLLPRQLIPLLLIIFIDTLAWFIVIPVLLRLFINDEGHFILVSTSVATRNIYYAIAAMLAPAAFMLAAPIIGHISDKIGRKRAFSFCLIMALIGFCLPIAGLHCHMLLLLFIGRFIAGFSTASQPIAQAAIADIALGKQKAFYMSLIACAMTLAMVLGPILGSYTSDSNLISWFSLATPYWIGVILAVLNLILLWWFYENPSQSFHQNQANNVWQHCRKLLRLIIQYKMAGLMLLLLFMEMGWAEYYQSIFLILQHHFLYTPDRIGLFTGYIGLWMSLGLTVIYKYLLRWLSVERIFYISVIIAAVGLFGCNFLSNVLWQWIFVVPVSIFVGTAYPSIIAVMSNLAPEEHQGWVLGLASTALAAAWMLTGFLVGYLMNAYVGMPIFISMLSMLCALVATPFLLWRSRVPRVSQNLLH